MLSEIWRMAKYQRRLTDKRHSFVYNNCVYYYMDGEPDNWYNVEWIEIVW